MLLKVKKYFPLSAAALIALVAVLSGAIRMQPAAQAFGGEDGDYVKVPILMYHHICKDAKMLGKYVISPQEFESDLIWIRDNGYEPVFVSDLVAFAQNGDPLPQKPIILSFDDGFESTYVYAHPLLEEYGMKGVVSVIGTYSELYSNTENKHINYSHLTWSQISEMSASGRWEIGNHSYDMHDLKKARRGIKQMSNESADHYKTALGGDLTKLQNKLSEVIGNSPKLFTYPFGYISKGSDDVLRDIGFAATLSCEEGVNKIKRGEAEFYRLKRYNRPHGADAVFLKRVCGEE